MPKKAGGGTSRITVKSGHGATEVASIAARELANGLGMLAGSAAKAESDPAIDARALVVSFGSGVATNAGPSMLTDDSFQISRPSGSSIAIHAGSERALLHASYDIMERLGARFIPGAPANFPKSSYGALAK